MPARKKLADTLSASIEKQSDIPLDSVKDESDFVDAELNRAIKQEQLKKLINENASFSQNMGERKIYARDIFRLTIVWSALIFLILFLCGWHGLFLSDKVIITLISSTTINFFGFFFLVTKYLFNAGASGQQLAPAKKKRKKMPV